MSYIALNEDEYFDMRQVIKQLYDELQKITVPLNQRKNVSSNKVRSITFGKVILRYQREKKDSVKNTEYPEIWRLIKLLGTMICPIPYTSVQLNHNVVCKAHTDKNNVGSSVIVSFGNYEGGMLVINNTVYDTNHKPIVFNGQDEHYNTNDLTGTKYSLVYFTIK